MRIGVVHSFYTRAVPSGENNAVLAQVDLLQRAGHDVILVSRETDVESQSSLYPARAALRVATGFGDSPIEALRRFEPDVVHVHNLFPNFGDRWATRWSGPIVVTAHNYRSQCANGLFLRADSVCTRCRAGSPLNGLRHSCSRASRVATLPLTVKQVRGGGIDPLFRRADAIVALTDLAKNSLVAGGINSERIDEVPNSVPDAGLPAGRGPTQPRALFVGRLDESKGIEQLAHVWSGAVPLDVIGEGSVAGAIAAAASNISLLGQQPKNVVREKLRAASVLVIPSIWFEGLPTVALEALECGVPIAAWHVNTAAEIVRQSSCGVVVDEWSAEAWGQAVANVDAQGLPLRRKAREVYLSRYSEQAWINGIEDVYRGAIERRGT